MERSIRALIAAAAIAIAAGTVPAGGPGVDCNSNGVPDNVDIANGTSADCNSNGVPDECDTASGASDDCNVNDVPDECEPDCNSNDSPDDCDIWEYVSPDCNQTWVPDECELDGNDCNSNGVPDECDDDCNVNDLVDDCEVAGGQAADCNGNGIPDDCDATVNYVSSLIQETSYVYSARTGDMDGDGDLDVVGTVQSGSAGILLYENLDGFGTFGSGQVIWQTWSARSVAPVDLDGDGDLDVLFGGGTGDVTIKVGWLENTNGRGNFGPARTIVSDLKDVQDVWAADVDGDGDDDVAVVDGDMGELRWYENVDGTGQFSHAHYVAGNLDGAESVFAGDMDGDGDQDLLSAARFEDEVTWFRNLNGDGTAWTRHLIATGSDPWDAVAADVDGDLDLDVIAALGSSAAWYENLGGGDFGDPASNGNDLAIALSRAVAAGDLDLDGDLDIVEGGRWHENLDGSGTFGVPRPLWSGAAEIDVADVTSDGVPDLVVAMIAGTSQLYEGVNGDCNLNDLPDDCDVSFGGSEDCSGNGLPDECEPDCNGNGTADSCDIETGASQDCTGNGLPDECEADCNGNGTADSCDVELGASNDCDADGTPDECQPDCNGNGIADRCDVEQGGMEDCDANGVPDVCDPDCNGDGRPDGCEVDCNRNHESDVL